MPTRANRDRCETCGKRSAMLYCESCLPSRPLSTERPLETHLRAIVREANHCSSLRVFLSQGR